MHGITVDGSERLHAGAAPRLAAVEAIDGGGGATVRLRARMAGVLWLGVIVTSMFAFAVQSPLIVRDDAAATARNILASETMYRLGFAANLVAGIFYLGVTVLLYVLMKPAGRTRALVAASLGVVGVTAGAAVSVAQLAPLLILKDAPAAGAFTPGQLQELAQAFLRIDAQGFRIAMLFFGLQIILVGVLIARSTFLPRVLGVLLAIGGASYIVSSLAALVLPEIGARLTPFVIPAALIGEGALTLWLIVKGVDAGSWQEQAARQ